MRAFINVIDSILAKLVSTFFIVLIVIAQSIPLGVLFPIIFSRPELEVRIPAWACFLTAICLFSISTAFYIRRATAKHSSARQQAHV
jgi:hypothetical protein